MGDGDLWDVEDTEGDEGQAGKRLAAVWRPTKDEVIEHNLTHIPCRNWCRHCVRGRVVNDPHPHTTHTENKIPVISIDYCWMSQGNVDSECLEQKETGEVVPSKWWKSDESGAPILTMKDAKSKTIFADVVPQKGVNAYAIKRMIQNLDISGYSRFILKSGQEPAIIALKNAVRDNRHKLEIMLEKAAVAEHEMSGAVETAVRMLQGMVRTIKDGLEEEIGAVLERESCIALWMIRHDAANITRFQKGEDGRLKGKRYKTKVCELGESVHALRLASVGVNKWDSRWIDGVWLGVRPERRANTLLELRKAL